MFDEESLGSELALGASPTPAPDSTITVLLDHRVTLPARATVGILHLPGGQARRFWFRAEASVDLTQTLADSAMAALNRAPRVGRAALLPALVVGNHPTVPMLREAAARLQAQMLMIYRPHCRLYERTPFLGPSQYRAACSIEALLLDTRSGVIPFSTVITREADTRRESGDYNAEGTWRRVQLQALVTGIVDVADRVGRFLTTVPEP